jgi:hypothetical protein
MVVPCMNYWIVELQFLCKIKEIYFVFYPGNKI